MIRLLTNIGYDIQIIPRTLQENFYNRDMKYRKEDVYEKKNYCNNYVDIDDVFNCLCKKIRH